jgi:hypothetical protein
MSNMPTNKTGWSDFLSVLSEFKNLSAATLGAAAAAPFVAALAGITPPSPTGIMFITGLVELVVLILVFQFLRPRSRATVNWVLSRAAAMLLIFSAVYLLLFFLFTFETPSPNPRGVRGFICKSEITIAEKLECPLISPLLIANAGYQADLLWKPWTIVAMRFALASLWFLNFINLSIVIGAFIVHQTKPPRLVTKGRRAARGT